ncbi:MAG: GAF domain-containing protein, partial [Desulfobacteraceae bacterium]|nr:GAF domain-containing protein [Desulfobacteraceae bacterium]
MIHIVIENAGAEKGFLLLPKQDRWFVEVQGDINRSDTAVRQSSPLEENEQLSAKIIYHVARTKENIILNKGVQESKFTNFPYSIKKLPKSLLCMPFFYQGDLTGILYLENNLMTEAFTPTRLGVLNLLSSQIAISIENSLNYANLEKMVKDRTFELDETNKKLKQEIIDRKLEEAKKQKLELKLQQSQKMESIGTLAGGIAHDFNNLLYPIIGFSEMLKEDLPPDSPEYDSAQEIFNAGRRGGELVKQILAFSRQTEHKLSPVRFQKILKEVCKLTRSTIPSDIKIHHDIQKDCGLIMAEATQLHQIAMNLITNAYHAVEKTSGEISIQLKEITLDNDDLKDSPLQSGQHVMLSVSDNGVGIPREIMNNIFEPYFTTKEKDKGTGLGLAVVYGILTEHKGDIKVYSEVGKGTTFNIYLPLMRKSTEAVSTEKELNKQTGTESILLVDDEESVVRLE